MRATLLFSGSNLTASQPDSPFDLCQTLFKDDNGDDQQHIQQDELYPRSDDGAVSTLKCDEMEVDGHDMHIQEGETRDEIYLVGTELAVEKAHSLLQESCRVVAHERVECSSHLVNHLTRSSGSSDSSQHSPLHAQQHTYEYTLIGWRGKLYRLMPCGTWYDCGTGRITISPSRMLCMYSEASSHEILKVLLQTPVSHDIDYEHDEEKTISWIQPAAPSSQDTSAELALSFEKKEGCLDILKHLSVGQLRSLEESLSYQTHDSAGGGEERISAETERISVETESLYKEYETNIQSNIENIGSLLNNFMTNTLDTYLQETEKVERKYIQCRTNTQKESQRLEQEQAKVSFLALKAQESKPKPASQDVESPLSNQESQILLPANYDTKAKVQPAVGKVETSFDNFLGTMDSYFQETEEIEKTYIQCRDNTQKESRRLEQVQNDFLTLKAQESKPKLSTAASPQKERIDIGDDVGSSVMSLKIQQANSIAEEELVDQETDPKKSESQVEEKVSSEETVPRELEKDCTQLKPPCITEVTVEKVNNDIPLSLRKRPEDASTNTNAESKSKPAPVKTKDHPSPYKDDNSLPTECLTPLPHKASKKSQDVVTKCLPRERSKALQMQQDLEESSPTPPQENKVQERPFPIPSGDKGQSKRLALSMKPDALNSSSASDETEVDSLVEELSPTTSILNASAINLHKPPSSLVSLSQEIEKPGSTTKQQQRSSRLKPECAVKRSPIRTFPSLSRKRKTHLEEELNEEAHNQPAQDGNEEIAIPSASGDQLLVVFQQWLHCRRKQHDDALFKEPPPNDICSGCSLPLPSLDTGKRYQPCCGRHICCGCIHVAHVGDPCPIQECQQPPPTTNIEFKRRMMDRVDANDAKAIHYLGCDFYHGHHGVSQNQNKALELWHQAGALGYTDSYYNIGCAYYHGSARIRKDLVKAKYYWTKAAIAGDAEAMYELGSLEKE